MKKYLFGGLLGLVLVPSAFVFAQTGVMVTPVSSSIKTEYNVSKPDQPWVVSTHTIKVKTGATPIYVSQYQDTSLVHTGNKLTPGARSSSASSTASIYVNGLYGGRAWVVTPNSEQTFSFTYKWDSGHLFMGSYYSRFSNFSYVTDPSNSDNLARISVSQQSNTIAVVGEKGPYISATSPTSLTLGSSVTISGERLSSSKAFLIPYYNLIPEGNPVELVVVSSSATNIVANIPTNIPAGQYLLEIRNNTYGNSNRVQKTVISGNSISRVIVASSTPTTWIQATSKPVKWTTTGSVPKVDVLVCYFRKGQSDACFYAYQNITNTGSVANVRVATNIPLDSQAYIKVRKAGTDTVMAKSSTFAVVKIESITAVQVVAATNSATVLPSENPTSSMGQYRIRFDVAPTGGTIFIPMTVSRASSSSSGVSYVIKDGTGAIVSSGVSNGILTGIDGGNTVYEGGVNYIQVKDSEVATFSLDATFDPVPAGTYKLQINTIGYKSGSTGAVTKIQLVEPLSNFDTNFIYINGGLTINNTSNSNQMASIISSLENLLNSLKQNLGFSN